MPEKLFITGGSGFLGGHLVALASQHYEVHATYFSHPAKSENVFWHFLDLKDKDQLKRTVQKIKPDIIIHNAAMANIDLCEVNKNLAHQVNYEATVTLAELIHTSGTRLIFISTDNVFDGQRGNYKETDPPNPVNYYGLTKFRAEEAIMDLCDNYVIARVALIYGFPHLQGNSFLVQVLRNVKSSTPIKGFTDQFRSPIYVVNLAEILLELTKTTWQGILHLGSPDRISRYDFIKLFFQIHKIENIPVIPVRMQDVQLKASRPSDLTLNINLAKNILKTPILDCQTGLKQMSIQAKI